MKTFFKSALQFGPWRISRKVMAFGIGFSVVVILFGIFTLHSHLFDRDWGDDWDDDWDDIGDDDLSSGDSIMLVIMGLAGMTLLLTSLACCLARHNVPMQLPSDTPVFTVQENMHQPVTTVPSAPTDPIRTRRGTRHVKAGIPDDLQPQDYPNPGYPGPPSYQPTPGSSHAPTHLPPHRSTSRRAPTMDLHHQPISMSDLPPPYAP